MQTELAIAIIVNVSSFLLLVFLGGYTLKIIDDIIQERKKKKAINDMKEL